MTEDELNSLIQQWEGPTLDFKDSRFLADGFKLARIMVALANTLGGRIVIGVRDDKTKEGMRADPGHEEFIMSIARDRIEPPVAPSFKVENTKDGDCYVITIPRFRTLPHALKTKDGRVYLIRVGSEVREPHSCELQILFSGTTAPISPEIESLRSELNELRGRVLQLASTTRQLPTGGEERYNEGREFYQNLIGTLRSFEVYWSSFFNLPQTERDIGDLQFRLKILGDKLTAQVSYNQDLIFHESITDELIEVSKGLLAIGSKRFFVDGGKSWNEFKEAGDELIKRTKKLIDKLDRVLTPGVF